MIYQTQIDQALMELNEFNLDEETNQVFKSCLPTFAIYNFTHVLASKTF